MSMGGAMDVATEASCGKRVEQARCGGVVMALDMDIKVSDDDERLRVRDK